MAAKFRCLPVFSRFSGMAMSPVLARRCTRYAGGCRPCARITSRRWAWRPSPFAKASRRRRMMVCTSSIGPGATNMVTAAAVAHATRLPLLLLPGDVFASRRPDPVLQQVEGFGDPTVSVNDCFRPVSRWGDRIPRPEQILESLPQALRVLTDPADCGPVTLALPQDVQAEAYDYHESFFAPHCWRLRRPRPMRLSLPRLPPH